MYRKLSEGADVAARIPIPNEPDCLTGGGGGFFVGGLLSGRVVFTPVFLPVTQETQPQAGYAPIDSGSMHSMPEQAQEHTTITSPNKIDI